MVLRYLFALTGPMVAADALGPTATRTDPVDIMAYLTTIRPKLDADGDGNADALSDGIMIIRYMFGLRGVDLTRNVLDPAAPRNTAQVEAYIASLMP